MLVRIASVLTLAACALSFAARAEAPAGFLRGVPERIRAKLASTNETHGSFVQAKSLPTGERFVSKGTYRIRPGVDFEWRVTDPFDSLFRADKSSYVYSNEDEIVTKPLDELPGYSRFAVAENGDFSGFFSAFDVIYKEDDAKGGGRFHALGKPRVPQLAKFLERFEADGTEGEWTLRARFPDGTTFEVDFKDDDKETEEKKDGKAVAK